MQTIYSPEQKSQGKAMLLAIGNATEVARRLSALWGDDPDLPRTPRSQTLINWSHDPDIEPDAAWLERYRHELRHRTAGLVGRMLGPLETRFEKEITNGTPLEVLNIVKSIGITVDKVNPSKWGPGMVIEGPVSIGGEQNVQLLFGPKALPAPAEEADGEPLAPPARTVEVEAS